MNHKTALSKLIQGNKRFIKGNLISQKSIDKDRLSTLKKQIPFAVIITCSDSRVIPEFIFDQGIGRLFIIRVAGNIVDDKTLLGSIEYGIKHLNIPLIIVLGHENCGAVKAAIEDIGEEEPHSSVNIKKIMDSIKPSVKKSKKQKGDYYENCIYNNIKYSVEKLKKLYKKEKVQILGAYYELMSGKVKFF